MKLNKLFLLLGIAVSSVLASCGDDDYVAGALPSGNQLEAVTFGTDNVKKLELDPADATTYTITVYRDSADKALEAVTVPVKVLKNTKDVFSVPENVTFKAGEKTAELVVTFNKAEIGVSYSLEVALDESFVSPYKSTSTTSFYLNLQRVKWNLIGTGKLIEDFWYGTVIDAEFYQRDDDKDSYRVVNPFTDEFVSSMEDTPANNYNEWIKFTIKSGSVVFEDYSLNTIYSEYACGVMCYWLDDNADNNYAIYKDGSSTLQAVVLNPYFYVPAAGGGWSSYYHYLVFPDQDLPKLEGVECWWLEDEEEEEE